ncbi:MAG: hypothetical protein GY847_11025 [Proteobacteria bacterium]|nr:hypothetical protein [Pseudomonadota bacterium]
MNTFVLPLMMPKIEAAVRDAQKGSEEARWVAAIALGSARGPLRKEAIKALDTLLSDRFEEVRAQALEGIAEQARGGIRASENAAKQALKDPSPGVRCAAIDAVAVLFDSPQEAVAPLLRDADPSVRAAAASALSELRAVCQADQLAELLDDPDSFVANQAAAALSALNDPRGERLLVSLLESSVDIACEAALSLGKLGRATSVSSLRKAAERRFSHVELKAMAAAAMVQCTASDGREILIRLLRARRQSTRMTVISVLARMPIKGMAPAVGQMLGSGRAMEISAAIQTLGALAEIDPEPVQKELKSRIGMLGREFEEELVEILQSLGSTG